jgi:hypothetical protein
MQCRRLSSLTRPFLYKYLYLRPNKHILLLRSINENPQLVPFIKYVGVTGNWNDQGGKELMGRLEREGVVFWTLPDVGFLWGFENAEGGGCFDGGGGAFSGGG